jgi:hypothetical protein
MDFVTLGKYSEAAATMSYDEFAAKFTEFIEALQMQLQNLTYSASTVHTDDYKKAMHKFGRVKLAI